MPTQKNSASWDLQLGFNLAFKRLIERHVRCLFRRPSVIHNCRAVSMVSSVTGVTKLMGNFPSRAYCTEKKKNYTNVPKLPNPSSWYSAIRTRDVCRMLGKFRSNESPYSLLNFYNPQCIQHTRANENSNYVCW